MGETQKYYLRGRNFKPRPGMVVVHNHIMHTKGMPLGVNGFRAWQQTRTGKLVECKCGWWGIEHYRIRAAGSGKAYTALEMVEAGAFPAMELTNGRNS